MSHHNQQTYLYGATAGFLTVFITQPFQVIRTSMMVTYLNNKPSGFMHIVKRLYREEGIGGLYRGIVPTLIKTPIATGIYFTILENNKRILNKHNKIQPGLKNFIASGIARAIQCIATNPILLIITRFEVIGFNKYKTFLHGFMHIYEEEGLRGYFKGLKALLIKEVPTGALFYTFYEFFKYCLMGFGIKNIQLQASLSAITANIILTFLNNPFDVVRTRLQYQHISNIDHHAYKSVFGGIYDIAKHEGVRGLAVGMVPRILKRSTGSAIAWTTYETLKRLNV
jgi:hypothetical protein